MDYDQSLIKCKMEPHSILGVGMSMEPRFIVEVRRVQELILDSHI